MKNKKYKYIIGIDEVGRGPLAGPVSVCSFCVESAYVEVVHARLEGITDSKKLTEKKREMYLEKIQELKKEGLIKYALIHVSARVIDLKGIVPAITLALNTSLTRLKIDPQDCFVYLDGGLKASVDYDQETVIKGDQKIWQIGAASVIAKVLRDIKMTNYGKKYPEYGFEQHKGYGTKKHKQAISKFGIIDIHRTTWIHIDN